MAIFNSKLLVYHRVVVFSWLSISGHQKNCWLHSLMSHDIPAVISLISSPISKASGHPSFLDKFISIFRDSLVETWFRQDSLVETRLFFYVVFPVEQHRHFKDHFWGPQVGKPFDDDQGFKPLPNRSKITWTMRTMKNQGPVPLSSCTEGCPKMGGNGSSKKGLCLKIGYSQFQWILIYYHHCPYWTGHNWEYPPFSDTPKNLPRAPKWGYTSGCNQEQYVDFTKNRGVHSWSGQMLQTRFLNRKNEVP